MVTNPNQPNPTGGTVHRPSIVHPPGTITPEGQTEGEKPKKEKKAKVKTGVARPRLARPDENHVITVMKPGAKTGKSGERFNQVRTGMTVKEYVDIMTKEPFNRTVGQAYFTLRWDTDPNRKLLNIGPTTIPVPEPEPKKEKKPKAVKEEAKQPAA